MKSGWLAFVIFSGIAFWFGREWGSSTLENLQNQIDELKRDNQMITQSNQLLSQRNGDLELTIAPLIARAAKEFPGEEINQSLKKIIDEWASRDPLNQSIATAVVTATLNVAPSKDHPWENTHEMGAGAMVGMGSGSNPVLIATCRDVDVSVNPDGSGTVAATCQAAPASVNCGSPVTVLRGAQYIQVNFNKATLPPNTLVTGGWVIWTINSAITLKFAVPPQMAVTGFQNTGQIIIRDVADGFKPLSSIPDKSASPH